jgi:dynein heavy chain
MPDSASIERIYATIIEGHFIPERKFSAAAIETSKKIVAVTRNVLMNAKKRMIPTPSKFHYTFNLRDLSRIVQGIIRVTPKKVNTLDLIAAVWAHECYRIFPDKFISKEDKEFFATKIRKIGKEHFGDAFDGALEESTDTYFYSFMTDIDYAEYEGIDESKIPRIYERVPTFEALSKRCQEFMQEYNQKSTSRGKKLDLVLFDDAMGHLVRISRIVGMTKGHAIFVGVNLISKLQNLLIKPKTI